VLPLLERSGHRRSEASAVTLTPGTDAAWCWAQALMTGFVTLVVANWLWALLWAWPDQEPPAWLTPFRWGSIGLVSLLAVFGVWRRSRARQTSIATLSWTSDAGWRCTVSGQGRLFPCAVRLAIDGGDWVLLRVDPLRPEGTSGNSNDDAHRPRRRAWLALSRSNHPGPWHDLRLALAHRSPK